MLPIVTVGDFRGLAYCTSTAARARGVSAGDADGVARAIDESSCREWPDVDRWLPKADGGDRVAVCISVGMRVEKDLRLAGSTSFRMLGIAVGVAADFFDDPAFARIEARGSPPSGRTRISVLPLPPSTGRFGSGRAASHAEDTAANVPASPPPTTTVSNS